MSKEPQRRHCPSRSLPARHPANLPPPPPPYALASLCPSLCLQRGVRQQPSILPYRGPVPGSGPRRPTPRSQRDPPWGVGAQGSRGSPRGASTSGARHLHPLSLAQTSCYIWNAYHLNDRCSKLGRTVYSFSPWGKARVSREEEEMSLARGDCPTQAGFYRSQVTGHTF